MQDHSIFVAVVITSNSGSGAVTVARESYGGSKTANVGMKLQGVVVSQTMANYLGFKESLILQPGSRVLCVENTATSCYIVGVIPWENIGGVELPARTTVGQGNALGISSNRTGHQKYTPLVFDNSKGGDVVDGEYVVANEFGVLLGLFQQFATLKASELAQVQCHLLDDLVRIVSHNYQHFTALGELNITHDGRRLMAEFGATHKPAEAYGDTATLSDKGKKPQFKKGAGDTVDDSSDYYQLDGDQQKKAIERFKLFVGSVGDFLNLFIVRPADEKIDTGLLNIHAGVDGGLHIRSAKEVFIEKTNWIRVPKRLVTPEDPSGDDAEKLEYTAKEKFVFEDSIKNKYAIQLRDYVAYVNQKLNYQNFKTHAKDFFVNDNFADEVTLNEKIQLDQETKEAGISLGGTAGIYLMPNGGITIRDAFNSAIVMENGHVYIQAAKDMFLQPAKDCVVKVGQNLSMSAYAHADISASTGGVRLKSEQTMHLHSNKGGMVFQADFSDDIPEVPYAPEQDPDKAAAETFEYLDAEFKKKKGEDNTPSPLQITAGIIFKTNRNIFNFSKHTVNYVTKNIYNQAGDQINTTAKYIIDYGREQHVTLSDNLVMTYTPKNWYAIAEKDAALSGNALALGQYKKPVNVMGTPLKGVLKIKTWKRKSKIEKFLKSREDLLSYTVFKPKKSKDADGKEKTTFLHDFIKFRFLKSGAYGFDVTEDLLPITAYQQLPSKDQSSWAETPVNDSQPYPGLQVWSQFFLTNDLINLRHMPEEKVSPTAGKDNLFYEASRPFYESGGFRLESLDTYGILGKPAATSKLKKSEEEEEEDPAQKTKEEKDTGDEEDDSVDEDEE